VKKKKTAAVHKGVAISRWFAEDVLSFNPALTREEAEAIAAKANTDKGMTWKQLHVLAFTTSEGFVLPELGKQKPAVPAEPKKEALQGAKAKEDTMAKKMDLEQAAKFTGLTVDRLRWLGYYGTVACERPKRGQYLFTEAALKKYMEGGAEQKGTERKPARKQVKKAVKKNNLSALADHMTLGVLTGK